jgi:hypothetical protein
MGGAVKLAGNAPKTSLLKGLSVESLKRCPGVVLTI